VENACGAEPAGGRAKQHFSESADTNAECRHAQPCEYQTPAEVDKLIAAAKLGRHGHRDATLILVACRHGLRAVEIADLEWSQVEWGRNPALPLPSGEEQQARSSPCPG
jgi:integrase